MFIRCSKYLVTLFLCLAIFGADIQLAAWGDFFSQAEEVVDRLYLARQNKNVVDNFGVLGLQRAEAAISSAEREYHLNIGPITGSASANYVYGSLLNPTGSGRTISIKKIMVQGNAIGAVNYVNLSVRRVTAATAGTLVSATDVPKKNSDSANSIAEVRHTGPLPTFSGATQSRLLGQPLPGAAGNEYSYRELTFGVNDETIVLQPGEGIAVYQEAAGGTNLRVTIGLEWEEVTSTPSAQNEYMLAIERVESAAAVNYVYNSFFNPGGSTKTVLVKRVWFGSETCDAAAVYTNNLTLRRVSAASGGTQITAANIPKKHTGSTDSAVEVRYTGVTVTQVGGVNARLGHASPCGTTGQGQGWVQYDFHENDEPLVIKPGEGIALIADAAGNANQINRMFIEWEEVDNGSAPASEGEYVWASDRVAVAAALGTTFYTLFNPAASGKTAVVKRLVVQVNAINAAAYSTFNWQRISAASAGNLITNTDLPKKNTASANSIMQIRWCGAACATAITTTYTGSRSVAAAGLSDSGIMKVLGPGAVGQLHGQHELVFTPDEPLVLKEGEGIGFYLNYLAGNVNHYVKVAVEWGEVVSAPTSQNQYAIDIGAMPGNVGASYNYATFFNPAASGKTAIIKKTAVRVNAVAAATYTPVQVKRISAASAGTLIAAADVPKKNTSTANTGMEIRRTGVTATYSQSTDAQFIAVQTPGTVSGATAIGQNGWRTLTFENDEAIIIQPGEGIVLNNNAAADVDQRVYWYLEWEEVASGSTPSSEGEYLLTTGPVTGSLTSGYVYASLLNPVSSNKLYVLSRLGIRADRTGTLTAPGNIPITVRGISAATGGTQITAANITEKHTGTTNTTAEVRRTGITPTYSLGTTARLLGTVSPGLVMQSHSISEKEFVFGDEFVLYPGEGIALYQESNAGDALIRYHLTLQWRETDVPIPLQTLTFSISDKTIGFGTLLPGGTRYATGDGLGSAADSTAAHTVSVMTSANDGYVLAVTGATLTCSSCGGATITPIGGTAVAPSVGSEQFGVRAAVVTGTGVVSAPYNGVNWALDTAAFPDLIATGSGDEVTTEFGIRYMSNIASNSESGSYTSNLTYIVTAGF